MQSEGEVEPDATGLDARRDCQAGPMEGEGQSSTVQTFERGSLLR
jgi:hypothetical protein